MSAKQGTPVPGSMARQPHNPISRPQIETIVSRSVAIFGILFGLQALPAALEQLPRALPIWAMVFGIGIYGGIAATLVASFAKRFVRPVNAYVSFAYLVALAGWPLVAFAMQPITNERPWLWLLCTVATSTAAIAFSTWQATAYLLLTPLVYGIVRVTPAGGGATLQSAILDIVYAVILGGAVLILITLLRQAAVSVDLAQGTALDRYALAVRQHATEVERVQVDSIVHDSVLTTLLSAARAFSPEAKELATRMAGNAIGHLRDAAAAAPDDDSMVEFDQLSRRIQDGSTTLASPFELRIGDVSAGNMPTNSAEALYSAAMQAMVNSLQHAGAGDQVRRWVAIGSNPSASTASDGNPSGDSASGGIRIEIGDNGTGFVLQTVPGERLGVRVSIIDRVANAGGSVEVDTGIGRGTTIRITWPQLSVPGKESVDASANDSVNKDADADADSALRTLTREGNSL